MRALIQRVSGGSVTIDRQVQGKIDKGMVILLGVKEGDLETDCEYLAHRCANLRIFEDSDGKMNLSLLDISGSALVISQFTLYGDTRKGHRPSYTEAAKPETAEKLYDYFCNSLRSIIGEDKVATGIFRAMMSVEIINDGPVTLMIESKTKNN